MAGLRRYVAELLARSRAGMLPAQGSDLVFVPSFGSNQGGLRMALHVLAGTEPNAPLVVVLDGCGQTAAGYAAAAGWLELADRYGFVVLCPEQARSNNPSLCFTRFEDTDIWRGYGEAEPDGTDGQPRCARPTWTRAASSSRGCRQTVR